MSKFSDRIGITKAKVKLERNGLSTELSNILWSFILEAVIQEVPVEYDDGTIKVYSEDYSINKSDLFRDLWYNFFRLPIDTIPIYSDAYGDSVHVKGTIDHIRKWYFSAEWYDQLNLLEYFSKNRHKRYQEVCNAFFKREFSAYRFINGILTEINSKEEIVEIESALSIDDTYIPVKIHLQTSLSLLSDKKNPDYRNSIKESVSAIESLCNILIEGKTTTLGKALKELPKKFDIPPSLLKGFDAIYGYASDKGGIRHALLEDDITVDLEEARFMLVACSAFTNYLIAKQ